MVMTSSQWCTRPPAHQSACAVHTTTVVEALSCQEEGVNRLKMMLEPLFSGIFTTRLQCIYSVGITHGWLPYTLSSATRQPGCSRMPYTSPSTNRQLCADSAGISYGCSWSPYTLPPTNRQSSPFILSSYSTWCGVWTHPENNNNREEASIGWDNI